MDSLKVESNISLKVKKQANKQNKKNSKTRLKYKVGTIINILKKLFEMEMSTDVTCVQTIYKNCLEELVNWFPLQLSQKTKLL